MANVHDVKDEVVQKIYKMIENATLEQLDAITDILLRLDYIK